MVARWRLFVVAAGQPLLQADEHAAEGDAGQLGGPTGATSNTAPLLSGLPDARQLEEAHAGGHAPSPVEAWLYVAHAGRPHGGTASRMAVPHPPKLVSPET